jgi:hypothetical protein
MTTQVLDTFLFCNHYFIKLNNDTIYKWKIEQLILVIN